MPAQSSATVGGKAKRRRSAKNKDKKVYARHLIRSAKNKASRAKKAARRAIKNAGIGHKRKGPSYKRRQAWRAKRASRYSKEPKPAAVAAEVHPVAVALGQLPVP